MGPMSPEKEPIGPDQARNQRIDLRVSPAEKQEIQRRAKQQGKDASEFLRSIALPEKAKPQPTIHKQAKKLADEFPVSPGARHPDEMSHGQVSASEWNRAVNFARFKDGLSLQAARKFVTEKLGPYPEE